MYQVKSQQRDRNGLGNPNLSSAVITDMRENNFNLLGEIVIFPEETCNI